MCVLMAPASRSGKLGRMLSASSSDAVKRSRKMSLLFELSDTSNLMIKLQCSVCVPNSWCAIAMVVHTWQHA